MLYGHGFRGSSHRVTVKVMHNSGFMDYYNVLGNGGLSDSISIYYENWLWAKETEFLYGMDGLDKMYGLRLTKNKIFLLWKLLFHSHLVCV